MNLTRRKFLKFLGLGAVSLPVIAKAVEVEPTPKKMTYEELSKLVGEKKFPKRIFEGTYYDEATFHNDIREDSIFTMPPPDLDNDYIRWQNRIRKVMNEATGLK